MTSHPLISKEGQLPRLGLFPLLHWGQVLGRTSGGNALCLACAAHPAWEDLSLALFLPLLVDELQGSDL